MKIPESALMRREIAKKILESRPMLLLGTASSVMGEVMLTRYPRSARSVRAPRAARAPLWAVLGCAAIGLVGLSDLARAQASTDDSIVTIALRPIRGQGPEVAGIDVQIVVSGAPSPSPSPFSVGAAITYASVAGIADRIADLAVRDDSGAVPLTIKNDPVNPGGFPYYRHWVANRTVTYPVTVTYRSLPQSDPPIMGPQFSFRAHAGGMSTAGSGFLALPEKSAATATRVHWDLSDMPDGTPAASSFGEGDFELHGPPDELIQGYFIAAPTGHYSPPEAADRFVAYWLGQPPFDPPKEMAWVYQMYTYQGEFFHETARAAYRVFIRAVPGATHGLGGTALENSFMLATPLGAGDPAVESPRDTIAHEMMHGFIGGLTGKHSGPWYEEGLTEYYTHLLLLRSSYAPVSDYEKSVNDAAQAYYSNPYHNASAEALDKLGFSVGVGAGSAQNVPYNRGRLYFANVDWKIRAASRGKRKLDDVILPLFEQRRSGKSLDVPALIGAFEKEYGPSARRDFESVIVRGETVVPASGAFGPCLERKRTHDTVKGRKVAGYKWVRNSVPDEKCREW
jgi:hypothetical protein